MRKKFTHFRSRIKSRHPSHDVLREKMPLVKFRSVIRLGSTTDMKDTVEKGGARVEINTVEAIETSSNKRLMKEAFTTAEVATADWWTYKSPNTFAKNNNTQDRNFEVSIESLPYPIVAKHIFGSRGTGNYLLQNQGELQNLLQKKIPINYIFEKFYDYNREYRLHVTKDGCFYTCRKMLKSDTPEDKRWFRNDSNSVWIVENNPQFDKPVNWDSIVEHSIKALNATGLDIGAVDVRVQSRLNDKDKVRKDPKFIIIEINSAPSFGKITEEKYLEQLPKILHAKHAIAK